LAMMVRSNSWYMTMSQCGLSVKADNQALQRKVRPTPAPCSRSSQINRQLTRPHCTPPIATKQNLLAAAQHRMVQVRRHSHSWHARPQKGARGISSHRTALK